MLTRSVASFSKGLPATVASVPACIVRPRNSCSTPLTTTSATARLARVISELDRRALAELAVSDPETFKAIVAEAKKALPADVNAPVNA